MEVHDQINKGNLTMASVNDVVYGAMEVAYLPRIRFEDVTPEMIKSGILVPATDHPTIFMWIHGVGSFDLGCMNLKLTRHQQEAEKWTIIGKFNTIVGGRKHRVDHFKYTKVPRHTLFRENTMRERVFTLRHELPSAAMDAFFSLMTGTEVVTPEEVIKESTLFKKVHINELKGMALEYAYLIASGEKIYIDNPKYNEVQNPANINKFGTFTLCKNLSIRYNDILESRFVNNAAWFKFGRLVDKYRIEFESHGKLVVAKVKIKDKPLYGSSIGSDYITAGLQALTSALLQDDQIDIPMDLYLAPGPLENSINFH